MICGIRSIAWHRCSRRYGQVARRTLTVTCRGSPITRDGLFKYTNGTFLSNEDHSVDRRYLKFNLNELCSIASRTGSISAVKEVEKMEGGFSKALLMRKVDGTEVVAKLPFKISGPAHYTTASEVAVLKYVHEHTNVPVPKVLNWSSGSTNPVGAEYIIMEKASGVQLVKIYGNMPDYDHLMLIKSLCALESELAAIKFPANGSLYLRQSLQGRDNVAVPLDPSADPEGQFCVGPTCDRTWYEGGDRQPDRGPWLDLPSWGQALVDREISRISNISTERQEHRSPHFSSKSEQIATLQLALEVITRTQPPSLPSKFASSTLWHTDLHLGNIYVSPSSPTQITSLIDWQSLSLLPLFHQLRFPEFLSLPEDYEIGGPVPQRPENLHEQSEDDRLLAEYEHKQTCLGRAYEAASGFKNKQVHRARLVPWFFKDFFSRISEVAEEGPAPLRACLIEMSKVWDEAGFAGTCPIQFTAAELANHEREYEDYEIHQRIQDIARDVLDTDSEGWIPPGIDIDAKRQQNQELLQLMMDKSAEYGKTPEEVRQMWPF